MIRGAKYFHYTWQTARIVNIREQYLLISYFINKQARFYSDAANWLRLKGKIGAAKLGWLNLIYQS